MGFLFFWQSVKLKIIFILLEFNLVMNYWKLEILFVHLEIENTGFHFMNYLLYFETLRKVKYCKIAR